MECKETGQFAHRETTQYEQLETFNAEVVAETKGAEEYVHLKSLEDEYHYMESTMPNKEGDPRGEGGADGQQQQQHDEGMYGEPVPHGTAEEAAAAQAAMEAEYAEAYHLYHQKCREQQERGEAPSEQDEACADMFRMSPRQPPPPFSDDTHQAQGFGSGYSSNNNSNTGCEGPSRGRGKGSRRSEEEQRAREAFAFAEDMEDLDEPPDLPHQQHAGVGEEGGEEEEAEQSQLFGEHIPFVGVGGGAGTNFYPAPAPVSPTPPPVAAARQGSGLRGKEYLFEPPSDGADPFVSTSSLSTRAEGLAFNKSNNCSGDANPHHQLPPRIPTTASPSDASSSAGAGDVADAAPAAATQHDDYLSRTSSYESLHEID